MPVSSAVADPYTTDGQGEPQPGTVPAEYKTLVAGLLALLAAHVAPKPGVETSVWAAWVMARLPMFRAQIMARLRELELQVGVLVVETIASLVAKAAGEAARDVSWHGPLPGPDPDIARSLMDALRAAHVRIPVVLEDTARRAVDAGRRAVGDPTPDIQRVLDDLAGRGITGYTDRAGRRWNLETYVETVTRAHYAQAAMDTYLAVIGRAGVGIVQVSRNVTSCPRCAPWQGRNLSIDGSRAGEYQLRSPGGHVKTVVVAGTLQEAKDAGLLHPWCRHRLAPVMAGKSTRLGRGPNVDQVARARRRYTARTARAWQRRGKVAITPQARQTAATRARQWQGRD